MNDLFSSSKKKPKAVSYNAADIEVLEGLEPVRRRPAMYIGGTDETALHHLIAEILDNAMDEAVAGHASLIRFTMLDANTIQISDDGRGIPVDPHPKFPEKSALEVILTTLHSGGKFSNQAYQTSGGLHGVGISVVCALAEHLTVQVARDGTIWQQEYSKGIPLGPLQAIREQKSERGTIVTFQPDTEIFEAGIQFRPARLFAMAKSKAYLHHGLRIEWQCPKELVADTTIPTKALLHFPQGLVDYLQESLQGFTPLLPQAFSGEATLADGAGRMEWALSWTIEEDIHFASYCNTIHTPLGGTHEQGFRQALLRGIKTYGERVNNKKVALLTAEDLALGNHGILSIFIPHPQFQGQTKEKLQNKEVSKWVEQGIKDHFDHWLYGNPNHAETLLGFCIDKAEARLAQKQAKETNRKTVMQRLRLPGKLADCTITTAAGTEIFLVEGDSAGGSAKKARIRETQAVLPLRGKILNVASSSSEKIQNNQIVQDIALALGCSTGKHYQHAQLRYERVIIMTDADVDGAHIASLLMTYFFQQMPELVRRGHLYLAKPPLYRIVHAGKQAYYARHDKEKDAILKQLEKKPGKVDISRFKGLGEMSAEQLRDTTMDPSKRVLLQVMLPDDEMESVTQHVDSLMGKKPELRYQFIHEQALSRDDLFDTLDI